MAGPYSVLDVTYLADEDLSGSQWCAVVVGTTAEGMVLPAGANAGGFLGILQDRPADGQQGLVRKLGLSWAIAGQRLNRGRALEIANASGHVRTALDGIGSYLGTSEQSADLGDRFLMFIMPLELTGSDVDFSSSSSSSSSNSSSSSSSSGST